MTLSSQVSRAGSSRKHMSSVRGRRRFRAAPIVIIGAILLAGALVFLLWPGGAEPRAGSSTPAASASPSAPAPKGAQGSAAAPGAKADHASQAGQADQGSEAQAALRVKPKVPSLSLDTVAPQREAPTFAGADQQAPQEGHPSASSPGHRSSATGHSSTPSSTPAPPPMTQVSAHTSDAAAAKLRQGMKRIGDGKMVQGRAVLSDLLFNDQYRLAQSDAQAVRDTLTSVNQKLVFSKQVTPGDPLAEMYTVQSGDLLSRIAPRYGLPYQFIERINRIHARNLRVGQRIKLIKGPFHARVVKHAFRLDVYLRAPDGSPIYVRSYPVGLGEENSTPVGEWVIKPGSKVVNPDYRNPRTNQYFKPNDPKNPVGEYWMAIKGTDQSTSGRSGYGIHGTINPDSIGTMASLGCVRLHSADIKDLFYMFDAGRTTVQIVP